jgi:6-phosphogluconolactonase
MNIYRFTDELEFLKAGLAFVENVMDGAMKQHEIALLALSGGKTPIQLYEEMGKSLRLNWGNIKTFLTDERMVPWESAQSNYKMVKNTLYADKNHANLGNFYDFPTNFDKDIAVFHYHNELAKISSNGIFDLIILGVGKDGHFGSIFPGYVSRLEDAWGGVTETEQFEIRQRLTMGPETIKKASKIMIWLSGPDKSGVVEELENGSKTAEEFPVKYLVDHPNLEIFYCA